MKKTFAVLVAAALLAFGGVSLANENYPMPSDIGTTGQILTFTDGKNVSGSSSVKVGSSGTTITLIQVLTATITSFTVPAHSCVDKAFTVTGVTTADKIFINPAYTAAIEAILANARAVAADTIEITFCNPNDEAADPEPGTINVLAVRS